MIVSFETAKIAKEKGFNIETHKCFAERKEHTLFDFRKNEDMVFEYIPPREILTDYLDEHNVLIAYGPTQSELQKWLREVHNQHMMIYPSLNSNGEIKYRIYEGEEPITQLNQNYIFKYKGKEFNTYEAALERGLQEALKLI